MIRPLYELFFPPSCAVCDRELGGNEELVCTACRHSMPVIEFLSCEDNAVTHVFEGLLPVKCGISLLYYQKGGMGEKLVHRLKYNGMQEIGDFAGKWLGNIIRGSSCFEDVQLIVPVPLHPKKYRSRGFNQLTRFGKAISGELEIPFMEKALLRTLHTQSQTKRKRVDRFAASEGSYSVNPVLAGELEGKHILLIDDVITTGATMESCGNALLELPGVTISVASLALTYHL